jgi:hypothetical protein
VVSNNILIEEGQIPEWLTAGIKELIPKMKTQEDRRITDF